MTVKDSFDVAGLPTTWGAPSQRDNIARADALSVKRLRDAGAVIFGKTNVPIWLADAPELQRNLRPHAKPVEHGPVARRVLRRGGGRSRGGVDGP